MQPIIEAYPKATFVLLHSSYPHTRDAGYLTALYANVYLDFGEVFPMVSADGQRDIVRQVFELAPTNKILFSSECFLLDKIKARNSNVRNVADGHWWPESFYLGTLQAREVLYQVSTVQRSSFLE